MALAGAAMQISLYFASHSLDSQKDLESVLKKFCQSHDLFMPKWQIKKVYETDSGEIFAVEAALTIPENMQDEDLQTTLARQLMAAALNQRFIPLDHEGHEIFLTPPYGFNVILYHETRGHEADLQKLIMQLASEMPGHEGTFNIQTHAPDDEPGEYYMAAIRIQDYWTEEARYRLMLAFYLRLLMLAKAQGFEAVITGKND